MNVRLGLINKLFMAIKKAAFVLQTMAAECGVGGN